MKIGKLIVIIAIGCGSVYAWNKLEANHPFKTTIYKVLPGDRAKLASLKIERDKKQATLDDLNKQLNTPAYCSKYDKYRYPTLRGTDPRPRWKKEIQDLNQQIYQLKKI